MYTTKYNKNIILENLNKCLKFLTYNLILHFLIFVLILYSQFYFY